MFYTRKRDVPSMDHFYSESKCKLQTHPYNLYTFTKNEKIYRT